MSMMDLTTLEGKDTPGKVAFLCRKSDLPAESALPGSLLRAVCVLSKFCSRGEEVSG